MCLFDNTPTVAQTPDGQTPAEEAICDPLKADGITKGLYGLCVAFCEAHDTAELSTPISEADLDALEDSVPSGRILANYNKRKKETDPTMPCVLVEEPCPCWTPDELAGIEGGITDGVGEPVECFIGDTAPFTIATEGNVGFIGPHRALTLNSQLRTPGCNYTNE